MSRYCIKCNLPLPDDSHGNKQYHLTCYEEMQNERGKIRYEKISAFSNECLRVEAILKQYHQRYGEGAILPLEPLIQAQMNWELSLGNTKKEGFPATVIGGFAYTIFENQTIKIWKI